MLGKWLHKHRLAHGVTRQRAAELSSVSLAQLWRMEAREEGSMGTYEKACAALGLEFNGILSGSSLGVQMRAERLKQGLSLRVLAKMAGVSVNSIRRCEDDAATIATASQILRVLVPDIRPRNRARALRALPVRHKDTRLTPPQFMKEVQHVIGNITLDPCAHECGYVEAQHKYFEHDDGLDPSNPWFGTCYINPPYSDLNPWIRRGYNEWRTGAAKTVALLLPARTSNSAFIELGDEALTILLQQRLRFYAPDRSELPVYAPFASMVLIFAASDDIDGIERRAREVWKGRFIPPTRTQTRSIGDGIGENTAA